MARPVRKNPAALSLMALLVRRASLRTDGRHAVDGSDQVSTSVPDGGITPAIMVASDIFHR